MDVSTSVPFTDIRDFGFHIAGEWRNGSGERRDVRSPATGKLICTVAEATDKDVEAACTAADAAFPAWAATDTAERARLLRQLARIIAERMDGLATLESA